MDELVKRANKGPHIDTVTALRSGQPDTETEISVMAEIREFNADNEAHEDLWARTRQAADLVSQATADAERAERARRAAELAYKTVQAEHPDRRAPRPRQWLIAAGALALDAVACFFAAEALGGSITETLVWAALFLAVLGVGELALDHYRETHRTAWWWIASVLSAFIVLLGVLRFSFLDTVGSVGQFAALAGAALFTLATTGFVIAGYRALCLAETSQTWRARRAWRDRVAAAAAARRVLDRYIARRDRLACAYLTRLRSRLLRSPSARELGLVEGAIMAHLTGQDQT
jgi:hypothetical protein